MNLPGDFPARGSDAARQLERQAAGRRNRSLEVLDRALRRKSERCGLECHRMRNCQIAWLLHDYGHRLYMTALAEAMGMTLPGASSIPAADSNHVRMAMDSGRRIVDMVWEDSKPHDILTLAAFRNAITVDMAIGGSTNAIIHLVALARRRGLDLPLHLFDEIARQVPLLANIRPSGEFPHGRLLLRGRPTRVDGGNQGISCISIAAP